MSNQLTAAQRARTTLQNAYQTDDPQIVARRYVSPANRNGWTDYQCLTCMDGVSSRQRIRPRVRRSPSQQTVVRQWIRAHGQNH